MVLECRIPAAYTGRTRKGKAEQVNVDTLKLVLLALSQWDAERNTIFMGVEYLSHMTQLKQGAVSLALRCLGKHGLIKREKRGMGQTWETTIEWDAVERLRQRWSRSAIESAGTIDCTADAEFGADLPAEPKPVKPTSTLAEELLKLELVGEKLTTKEANTVADSLIATKAGQCLLLAIAHTLSIEQLTKISEGRSPVAYLRTTLTNELKQVIAEVPEYTSTDDGDKVIHKFISEVMDGAHDCLHYDIRDDKNHPDFASMRVADATLTRMLELGAGQIELDAPYIAAGADGSEILLIDLRPVARTVTEPTAAPLVVA